MVDGARLSNGKFFPIKQTNADKYFRHATDEEIAEIIVEDWCELLNCGCQIGNSLCRTCDGMCKERVLEQEVPYGE